MLKNRTNKTLFVIVTHLLKTPITVRLSYVWNLGSILGFVLVSQIFTGVFLVIFYTCDSLTALIRVEYIIREVGAGWLFRVIHLNGASLFFVCLYAHMVRGLLLGSLRLWKVWVTGMILFVLVIGEAFLGYVLPWGQMSVWGACVITRLLRVVPLVGDSLVVWIWGGLIVNRATLGCFFRLHYLLPLIILVVVGAHVLLLHEVGRTRLGGSRDRETKLKFWPYLIAKDGVDLFLIRSLVLFCCLFPLLLGDCENLTEANLIKRPVHIQPEWYFLLVYAILRAIPRKLGGVIALCLSLVVIATLRRLSHFTQRNLIRTQKVIVRGIVVCVVLLTWLGSAPVEYPLILFGQVLTAAYFFMFLLNTILWFLFWV